MQVIITSTPPLSISLQFYLIFISYMRISSNDIQIRSHDVILTNTSSYINHLRHLIALKKRYTVKEQWRT